MVISSLTAHGEIRQRQDCIDQFFVPIEHLGKIFANSCHIGNLLHEPDIAVQPILILGFDDGSSGFPTSGEFLSFAHVPIFREDEPGSFINGGKDVFRAWNKLVGTIQRAPMDAAMLRLAGFRILICRLCTDVAITADVVDGNPILSLNFQNERKNNERK